MSVIALTGIGFFFCQRGATRISSRGKRSMISAPSLVNNSIFSRRTPPTAPLPFPRLNRDSHPLFENLGELQGPLPIDDGHIVAAAASTPQPDAVADLAREELDFFFVAPGRGRRKMLGGVRRCFPGFYLLNDGVDPIQHLLIPVLLLVRRLPTHNETAIGASPVAHIDEAAQRAIDQITHLDDPAGLMEGAVKRVWSGAPAPWHCRFGAVFISRSRGNGCQISILDSGL